MTTNPRQKRLPPDVRLVVEDWHRRIGNRPFLLGPEARQALVAQCVLYLMIVRSAEYPDRPIGDYVRPCERACDALGALVEG